MREGESRESTPSSESRVRLQIDLTFEIFGVIKSYCRFGVFSESTFFSIFFNFEIFFLRREKFGNIFPHSS